MVGIFAVSAPTYRPLWKRVFSSSISTRTGQYSPDQGRNTPSSSPSSANRTQRSVKIFAGSDSESHQSDHHVNVTREIDLVTHAKLEGKWVMVPDDEEANLREPEIAHTRR